jgi:hypothetical protein
MTLFGRKFENLLPYHPLHCCSEVIGFTAISEPEAAFTYCHYIPTTWLQGSKPGIIIKDPGTKSMIVDLGGILILM